MAVPSIVPYADPNHLLTDYSIIVSSGFGSGQPYIDDTGGYWTTGDLELPGELSWTNFVDALHWAHVVTSVSVGQLEDSSHKADGSAWYGTGNLTNQYLKLYDHTSNVEFGLETHYRTGDYVTPVKNANDEWIATMDAGLQNGQHNEQGSSTTRSGASFDISLNFGNKGPSDGAFVLQVNDTRFVLEHSGNNWFFADGNHNVVQGLTLSPDGHVLQDGANLAFFSSYLAHGANPADISPQDIHIVLTEMDSVTHLVGVASVSETIHLV